MEEKDTREKIHISVRKLVEFLFREGDIDEGTGSVDPVLSMREGQKIHKKIQDSWDSGYVPEVPLKTEISFDNYDLLIDGRADGVVYESGEIPVMVEEIKGIYLDPERLEEPIRVHLAQAMCYAYILAKDYGLDTIAIRMTYCNLDTEEIKYFEKDYSEEELNAFWSETILSYKKWADFSFEWRKKRNESIIKLDFPYNYREGQRKLVANVYKAISDKKILFIQAPTGSGKTISTMYPSMQAVGRGQADRVFYLTGKTVTKTVAIDTSRLCNEAGAFFKTVELTAKDRICPLDERKCNPKDCPYAKGHFDRVNDAVFEIINEEDIITKDILMKYAEEHVVCPFEFSLDISLWCDMIIGDYNYVFHPNSYLKRFFGEVNKEKYIFLIDEAHNLVDRGRSMYSETICKEEVLEVKRIMRDKSKKIVTSLTGINNCFNAWKKDSPDGYNELAEIDTFIYKLMNLCSLMEKFFDKKIHFEGEDLVRDFYFKLRNFRNLYDGYDERYLVYTDYDERGRYHLYLFCMDPSRLLQERLNRAISTVFFSATLLPMNYYKNVLCTEESPYAAYAKTVFCPDQEKILIGNDVTTKYTERSTGMYDMYASYIYEIVRRKTGNYMVFFPSYRLMEDVYERFESYPYKGRILFQERESSEEDKERFLKAFEENPKESLVAFSVMGGLYSEGIDLTGDRLIGVIIVGTGLPMVGREREILKNYFDWKKRGTGFDYAYLYPGMCKVLQAAGRLIRTEEDRGLVALLDSRFEKRDYSSIFPREWENKSHCTINEVGSLVEDFWNL